MATSIVPRISGIYLITCSPSNRFYLGSSVHIHRRWSWHKGTLKRGNHHSILLQRAWNKYGKDSFTFAVIEECPPEMCIEREQYWLDTLKPYDPSIGFNIGMDAKAPSLGRKHTAEHRAKIGLKSRRPSSPEKRAKISAAHKGRKHTAQSRANMSAAHKGKKQTPEEIEKRIAPLRGRKTPREIIERRTKTEKAYIVTDPNGKETYVFGLSKFCREHGLQQALMSKVAVGKRKHHKGWKCQFALI